MDTVAISGLLPQGLLPMEAQPGLQAVVAVFFGMAEEASRCFEFFKSECETVFSGGQAETRHARALFFGVFGGVLTFGEHAMHNSPSSS
jgi:hypothetical protein